MSAKDNTAETDSARYQNDHDLNSTTDENMVLSLMVKTAIRRHDILNMIPLDQNASDRLL